MANWISLVKFNVHIRRRNRRRHKEYDEIIPETRKSREKQETSWLNYANVTSDGVCSRMSLLAFAVIFSAILHTQIHTILCYRAHCSRICILCVFRHNILFPDFRYWKTLKHHISGLTAEYTDLGCLLLEEFRSSRQHTLKHTLSLSNRSLFIFCWPVYDRARWREGHGPNVHHPRDYPC